MTTPIPSAEAVRAALAPITFTQLERLYELSGVPVATLYKIKRGEIVNPGIDTVGKFMPHIASLTAPPAADAAASPAAQV